MTTLEFLSDEVCAECGEVVYGGQMPRHFAKDHAREDEERLAWAELTWDAIPVVPDWVLEVRTRPIRSILGVEHRFLVKRIYSSDGLSPLVARMVVQNMARWS